MKGIDGRIRPGDVVLCFNFRTDRCREITQALTQEAFPRWHGACGLALRHHDQLRRGFRVQVLYDKPNLTKPSEVVSAEERRSSHGRNEKYPHVTFFFSGGRKCLLTVSSGHGGQPKVATTICSQKMSAPSLPTRRSALTTWQPDFLCLNFANS